MHTDTTRPSIYLSIQVENTSHTSTAVETYQLDVESTALVSCVSFLHFPITPANSALNLSSSIAHLTNIRVRHLLDPRRGRHPLPDAHDERNLALRQAEHAGRGRTRREEEGGAGEGRAGREESGRGGRVAQGY